MNTLENIIDTNEYVYTQKELQIKINTTIDNINRWVLVMNYQITGDITKYKNINKIFKLSRNQIKKINRYANLLNHKKISHKYINQFLHTIYKMIDISERVYIKKSDKELKIQKSRSDWKIARDNANKLLSLYKNEKGDYYKIKTENEKAFVL